MQEPTESASECKDPIELLIARILRDGLSGALASGVIGFAPACTESIEATNAEQEAKADDAAVSEPSRPPPAEVDASTRAADAARGRSEFLDAALSDHALEDSSSGDAATADAALGTSDGGLTQVDASTAPFACDPALTEQQKQASGLRLNGSFDYIAIRRVRFGAGAVRSDGGSNESWTRTDFVTVSEHGEPCATARGRACAEKVARHPAEFVGFPCLDCGEHSVVTTRGDQVKRWVSDADLQTLMGEVDSANEATLLALRAGYWDGCAREAVDGYDFSATRYTDLCPVIHERVRLHIAKNGELRVLGAQQLNDAGAGVCIGRVPAALLTVSQPRHRSELGDYLAACAHLEHASVYAFERLARELAAYDAPRDLIAAALRAADDEIRHTRMVGAQAHAHAGEPVAAEVAMLPARTLEEIALENATEGCVRETFGALVGGYQAQHASDLELRTMMREIAADEARHAALSQRVHAWTLTQLDEAARARVLAGQRAAIRALYDECGVDAHAAIREPLGLPCPRTSQALMRALSSALWGAGELTPCASATT